MIIEGFSVFLVKYLVEILLAAILSIQVTAFSFLWKRTGKNEKEIQKNTETMTMVLNRMFGLDRDETDEGHIVETENKIDDLAEMLEQLAKKQEENRKERRKDHECVNAKIDSIIRVMAKEEKLEIEEDDFK